MPVSFTIQQASSPGQINKFGETQEAHKFKNTYCVLQASTDGINIYKKSGFQAIGKMTVLENRHLIE
ncbi:Uncharacterised protein [Streptococcus pneumoniae]|nr:Uncharacterised protein [Streptococcus pneumoniae]